MLDIGSRQSLVLGLATYEVSVIEFCGEISKIDLDASFAPCSFKSDFKVFCNILKSQSFIYLFGETINYLLSYVVGDDLEVINVNGTDSLSDCDRGLVRMKP